MEGASAAAAAAAAAWEGTAEAPVVPEPGQHKHKRATEGSQYNADNPRCFLSQIRGQAWTSAHCDSCQPREWSHTAVRRSRRVIRPACGNVLGARGVMREMVGKCTDEKDLRNTHSATEVSERNQGWTRLRSVWCLGFEARPIRVQMSARAKPHQISLSSREQLRCTHVRMEQGNTTAALLIKSKKAVSIDVTESTNVNVRTCHALVFDWLKRLYRFTLPSLNLCKLL